MSAPRFGPTIGDAIADLRSRRGAHGANEANRDHIARQANTLARAVEIHGAATVADVATRFPTVFADHHYTGENQQ